MSCAKMNGRERALAAMSGAAPDRPPVFFYRRFAMPDGDNNASRQVNWARACGLDMTLITNDGFEGYPLWVSRGDVRDLENADRLAQDGKYISAQVDRAKRVSRELSSEMMTFYFIETPFGMLKKTFSKYFGRKEEEIMMGWRENRSLLESAMGYAMEAQIAVMERIAGETSTDGFFISLSGNEFVRFTEEEYCSLLEPWDKKLIAEANSLSRSNIVHFCPEEGVPNRMTPWKDYDYSAVSWGSHIEYGLGVEKARGFFRPGTVLVGGFDCRQHGVLSSGTREEVDRRTKELVAKAGDERFVISADCFVSDDLAPERIAWVAQAADETKN